MGGMIGSSAAISADMLLSSNPTTTHHNFGDCVYQATGGRENSAERYEASRSRIDSARPRALSAIRLLPPGSISRAGLAGEDIDHSSDEGESHPGPRTWKTCILRRLRSRGLLRRSYRAAALDSPL